MKKLLFLLLFVTNFYAQTVTYVPSILVVTNPERGFFHSLSTGITTSGYQFLSLNSLNTSRTNENMSTIQRLFYMNEFMNTNISQTYLNNIQTDFNTLRTAGFKATIRFSYSKTESTAQQQPTKAQILLHIQQLATILELNKDVISCIQAGFIGTWGEWYYSNSTEFGTSDYELWTATQWSNRKQVLDAMINSFPQEIPLQLRYIYSKTQMYGSTYVGRIGFYNDAFLNAWGDSGTFFVTSATGTNPTQETYLSNQTLNLPMTGETDGVNGTRTNCGNATLEMNKYNWSQINKDYLQANISNWQTNGCYIEMDKYLGYRFMLKTSTIYNNVLSINLGNYGYANLFKDRKAYLIFKNITNNNEYSFVVDNNIKNCTSTNYSIVTDLNAFTLPNGTYKLYLNLPDPLNNNVLYSIQTANVNTWIASNGYNDLLQTWTKSSLSVNIYVENNVVNIFNLNNYTFKFYNINGKLLKYNSLNISGLSAGIYILKVKSSTGEIYTQKIIKT